MLLPARVHSTQGEACQTHKHTKMVHLLGIGPKDTTMTWHINLQRDQYLQTLILSLQPGACLVTHHTLCRVWHTSAAAAHTLRWQPAVRPT